MPKNAAKPHLQPSERLALALRRAREGKQYKLIKSSGYFDEVWYRLAYQNAIEFPHDLLFDYLRAGIPNERDPSPYFNTTLYRREHDVQPEKALVHFLKSGRDNTSGAYRDEHVFLACQQAFHENTDTRLVVDRRDQPRRFAVYLQCGAGSLWEGREPASNRLWDLLINHYDTADFDYLSRDVEFRQIGALPGTKFTSFYKVLEKFPEIIEPYEYILLLDDDIFFEKGDISRLFAIVQQHGWEMAQASLSIDSHSSFPVFVNPGKGGWRNVNGVEIMMPVYSRRILGMVKDLIGQSISGWGFDAALAKVSGEQGFRAAVVDDIIAKHTKEINADTGDFYRMLHNAKIFPEIEFTHLQKKHGFTKPLFYEL